MKYQLKRYKRSKSIKVRVEADGSVLVTAPNRVAKGKIERFLQQSEPWIKKQQAKIQSKKEEYPLIDWENEKVRYLGTLYEVVFSRSASLRVEPNGRTLIVAPLTGLKSDMEQTVITWLKRKARDYLHKRVAELAGEMGLTYNSLKLRQQKSRWGSCSAKGNLNFNWRLIHFNEELIDYVIIHELAHLKHLNHSKVFWQLVGEYDQDFRKHRAFLKKQVVEIA